MTDSTFQKKRLITPERAAIILLSVTSRSFAVATGFVNVKTVVEPFGVKDCFGNELTNPCVGVVPMNGILYSYVICIKPRTASSDEAALA